MADKKMPLQEAVLTLICTNGKDGALVAAQLRPEYFDGVYRDFAERVLSYRRRHREPPGRALIDDLADQSFTGKENLLVKRRLIPKIVAEAKTLNVEYVRARTQDFIESQLLKAAIMEASDRYDIHDDQMVTDVKGILLRSLKYQGTTIESGLFLNDTRGIEWARIDDDDITPLGIERLDELSIGLSPKEMLLYIAPKGTGKTWFGVHCGKQGLLSRKRVLHVSLEMGEMKIARRYYQSLFAIARTMEAFDRARFSTKEVIGDFPTVKFRKVRPALAFTLPRIRRVLRRRVKLFGTRLGNMVIKEFASGQMTMDMLVGYLDYLGDVHNFIPDILIVDYPDLMSTNAKNYRLEMGQNFVDLRGLGQKRNMAIVAPTQGTRETLGKRRVRSNQVSENIGKVFTADTVLSYSRTPMEAKFGLGRLSVEHARDNREGFTLVMQQSYSTGQYCMNSHVVRDDYWKQIDDKKARSREEADDDT